MFKSIAVAAAVTAGFIGTSASADEHNGRPPAERKAVYPDGVVPIAPYSPGILYGDLLFVAGQIPHVKGEIPAHARDGDNDIQDQTKIVLQNLQLVLNEASMDWKNVLQVTVFVKDLALFGEFNAVYGPIWSEAGIKPPARATVEVSALPGGSADGAVLIEMAVIAGR